jgi:hypothetical protein
MRENHGESFQCRPVSAEDNGKLHRRNTPRIIVTHTDNFARGRIPVNFLGRSGDEAKRKCSTSRQCNPASNHGYALVHINVNNTAGCDQIRSALYHCKEVFGNLLSVSADVAHKRNNNTLRVNL